MNNLIPVVQGLADTLHSKDADARGINQFVGCYRWEVPVTELLARFQTSGGILVDDDDIDRLWTLLTEDIPDEIKYLKVVYIPMLEDVLKPAGNNIEPCEPAAQRFPLFTSSFLTNSSSSSSLS
jgi:hypothetical protein